MAEPFRVFTSAVIPLAAENVDTDQIVPARYLKVTDKAGLADALFRDRRFEEDGSLKEPRFVLDQPEMQGRGIMLVGDNFGAGSSREHAPWALTAWGIRAILSTSYADIFRSNSLKNGVLPIVVDPDTHARLFALVAQDPDASLTIDLAEQGILLPDGSTIDFEIDPFAKHMILAGTDELGYLLSKEAELQRVGSRAPAPDRYPGRGELTDRRPVVGRFRPRGARSSGSGSGSSRCAARRSGTRGTGSGSARGARRPRRGSGGRGGWRRGRWGGTSGSPGGTVVAGAVVGVMTTLTAAGAGTHRQMP